MGLHRFFGLVIIVGLIIIMIPVGAMLLVIVPMLPFVGGAALLLLLYLWPIVGAVVSWQSVGLFYQPEKKQHYWGLGLLFFIYGVGLLCSIGKYSLFGDWVFLGNSIGLILRSILIEWRVAEGRARRLSINLLLALVLPLTVKAFFA